MESLKMFALITGTFVAVFLSSALLIGNEYAVEKQVIIKRLQQDVVEYIRSIKIDITTANSL